MCAPLITLSINKLIHNNVEQIATYFSLELSMKLWTKRNLVKRPWEVVKKTQLLLHNCVSTTDTSNTSQTNWYIIMWNKLQHTSLWNWARNCEQRETLSNAHGKSLKSSWQDYSLFAVPYSVPKNSTWHLLLHNCVSNTDTWNNV